MKTKTMFSAFLLIALFLMAASSIYAQDKQWVVEYGLYKIRTDGVDRDKCFPHLDNNANHRKKTVLASDYGTAKALVTQDEGFSRDGQEICTEQDSGRCCVRFDIRDVREAK